MSSSGWQVVDNKQKKAEKQQQRSVEKKKLQKEIEKERQSRKEAEEQLSYSGWGPEAEEAKKLKKANKNKNAKQPAGSKKKDLPQVGEGTSFTAQTIYTQLQAFEEAKEQKARAQRSAVEWKAKEAERAAQAEAEAKRQKEKERKKKKAKKPSVAQLSAAVRLHPPQRYNPPAHFDLIQFPRSRVAGGGATID
jgi:hypothetical protein